MKLSECIGKFVWIYPYTFIIKVEKVTWEIYLCTVYCSRVGGKYCASYLDYDFNPAKVYGKLEDIVEDGEINEKFKEGLLTSILV